MASPPLNLLAQAVRLFGMGQLEPAAQACNTIARLQPTSADPHYLLGLIRDRQGRAGEAAGCFERFVTLKAAVNARRRSFEDQRNLGIALLRLQRPDEAIGCFRAALGLRPNDADLLRSLGVAQAAARRFEAAVTSLEQALAIRPDAQILSLLGDAQRQLRRYDAATASFRKALALDPAIAEAHTGLGVMQLETGAPAEAAASFQAAIAANPRNADLHFNLGVTLKRIGRHEAAIASLRNAVAINPGHVQAQNSLGNSLKQAGQYDAALACYEAVLASAPRHANAVSMQALIRRQTCDWRDIEALEAGLIEDVRARRVAVAPFTMLGVSDDPAVQLQCARQYWNSKGIVAAPRAAAAPMRHSRLRLGYLSAELRTHPIPCLVAELFEEHDRSRFEVFAFSYGDDDGTPMRRRLEQAFDGFFDVRGLGDDAIARRIREQEIDIMVDLTGHTAGSRLEILASRPAPVQLHYIGHPGTLGVDFIDYLIVDPFVVPPDEQQHYSEALVTLSQCYQANDRKRAASDRQPSRAEAGLPPDGLVFCCFNQSYKFTPALFGAWMGLLHAVPGSVLWLLADNRWAEDNLRREAAARGVAPERLVFAPRLPVPEHLARHRLADLFLDTFPYNAHTTASDALWMSLPVLTLAGRGFASRVAGSLLHAVGLPELITHDREEYERLALALAREPARLAALRRHLDAVRTTAPLFDLDRTRREIEQAYRQMWELAQRGEVPQTMVIGAGQAGSGSSERNSPSQGS
jgi:predicted O-linked N-acetylglucosamine transferase (SPINDLY family)